MFLYIFSLIPDYFIRLTPYKLLQRMILLICIPFIFLQYLCIKLYTTKEIPITIGTRLYQDKPLTFDLQSYSVCHPKEFHLDKLISQYHQIYPNEDDVCFVIEDLNGGAWWSYVSQEFAEILTQLKDLGIQSNISYRSFTNGYNFDYKINLTKYFFETCNINENLQRDRQKPIIILLWNIDRHLWHYLRSQWMFFKENTRMRLLVFIDDLHFRTKGIQTSRQFLFESVATEIFSTYAYLFHNYYSKISPKKITWLPHATSILSYHSINLTSENRLFVSGANMYDWYPCRWRAFRLCPIRKDLVSCLEHPGYGEKMKTSSQYFYGGQRYFSYMRRYKFGLGTCQSVHYAIGKLFEIPANGLVLVTTDDLIPILEKLHLKHNKHFLTIDCSNEHLINEISRLQNRSKDDLLSLRRESQEIIFQRHLTKHRAQLLHARLLSQALLASSTFAKETLRWNEWGKNC